MADLASLRHKYDPVIKLMHARGAQVRSVEMQGTKLLLKAEAPSADVKNAIRDYVLHEGYDPRLNSFVAVAGESDIDASLLYAARVGIVKASDPRMTGTIDAIRTKLGRDDLVYRYDTRTTEDGLPSGEGAFLACSMWLVEALALADRRDEAEDVFEKMLRRANDVGLFSEEADPDSGELLGNFPQALTHIGLMNAALCLSATSRTSRGSSRTSRAQQAAPAASSGRS